MCIKQIKQQVCILIINLQENEGTIDINIIDYYINYDTYGPTKQLSAFLYNDYLLLGTTLLLDRENYPGTNLPDYLSMFMIFGYPNGTDSIINIKCPN